MKKDDTILIIALIGGGYLLYKAGAFKFLQGAGDILEGASSTTAGVGELVGAAGDTAKGFGETFSESTKKLRENINFENVGKVLGYSTAPGLANLGFKLNEYVEKNPQIRTDILTQGIKSAMPITLPSLPGVGSVALIGAVYSALDTKLGGYLPGGQTPAEVKSKSSSVRSTNTATTLSTPTATNKAVLPTTTKTTSVKSTGNAAVSTAKSVVSTAVNVVSSAVGKAKSLISSITKKLRK